MTEQVVRKLLTADFPSPNLKVTFPGMERVESGAVQFNDDWPGLFIRGDRCIDLYNRLEYAKNVLMDISSNDITHALSLAGIVGVQQMIMDHVLVKPKASI